ncbi:MAG: lipopolysaccharide heptosyltransferase II [Acidimicrobiia bacterium]|nr:lipopolysaccharide heptosyltransferase II [Acidimicrobiia bacterium]
MPMMPPVPGRLPGRPVPDRLVALAPNWLGDAVMALPALADVRRAGPDVVLAVAARSAVAGLFAFVPGVSEVVPLGGRGPGSDVAVVRRHRFGVALLLPNSFRAAWITWRAGVPERWGYQGDGRSLLLTRAVPRPPGPVHQAVRYQRLTEALGFAPGPLQPLLKVPDSVRVSAAEHLAALGFDPSSRFAVLAPGAAYGGAKRWPPDRVAALATSLLQRGLLPVVVGSAADRPTAAAVLDAMPPAARSAVVDLTGQTTLESLVGVLSLAVACVSNDSGVMHLGAALGVPVVAIFGPTDERQTGPSAGSGGRVEVLTHAVWCRPCHLRECPIDHGCMRGIAPDAVCERVLAVMHR